MQMNYHPVEKLPTPATATQLNSRQNQHYTSDTRHRLRKIIPFLGLAALIMWLLHTFDHNVPPVSGLKPVYKNVAEESSSRKQFLDTGAQALSGQFDLFDLLFIKSTSGQLSLGVNPQPADKDNSVPADLSIESKSGQISINFPAWNAPDRMYRTSIGTASGSVSGHVLHGQSTSVTTQSGSIDLQVTPFAADEYPSTLGVSSGSASQEVTVLSPANAPGTSIKRMASQHSSASGSVVLRYPTEWEGTIEGSTSSGGITLHGNDLEMIVNTDRHVVAKRGNGNSSLNFNTGSGSVDVYFG